MSDHTPPPRDSHPEYAFLLVSVVLLTAAVALASRDSHPADGLYSALACISAVCGCGWVVWSVERRRQRDAAEQREMIAALREDFAALRSALAQQSGGVYVARAVGHDTVRLTPPVLGQDALDAANRIHLRLLNGQDPK